MECPRCGERLYEQADFCDACGCDLRQEKAAQLHEAKVYSGEMEEAFSYHGTSRVDEMRLKKKKTDKKSMVVSLVLFASVLLVFVLVGTFVYGRLRKSPYEKKVDELVGLLNGDVTTFDGMLEALFPEFIQEDFDALLKAQCKDDGLDYDEEMRDVNTAVSDFVKTKLNKESYKFSYELESERELGKEELQDVEETYTTASKFFNVLTTTGESYKAGNKVNTYEAYMKLIEDFTSVSFEKGYELDVKFIMKDSTGEVVDKTTAELIVVNVDGEWMIDYMHYLDELSGLLS